MDEVHWRGAGRECSILTTSTLFSDMGVVYKECCMSAARQNERIARTCQAATLRTDTMGMQRATHRGESWAYTFEMHITSHMHT